jgi:excisionase family DNA binding protein
MLYHELIMERISDFYTVKEAADTLGVCSDTLRRWDRNGKLKPVRHPLNNYRLYKRGDIENVLKALSEAAK